MPKHKSHKKSKGSGHRSHRDPYDEPPNKVEVLCIPADGSELKIRRHKTTEYDDSNSKNVATATKELERRLGHVPDLNVPRLCIQDPNKKKPRYTFNLQSRCLYYRDDSPRPTVRKGWEGEYYLYKCVERTELRLPKNKYFRHFENARVFGNAFVFRVKLVEEFDDGKVMASFGRMKKFKQAFYEQHHGLHPTHGSRFDFGAIAKDMARW